MDDAGFYEKRSTAGRKLPRLPLQSELKRRAQELVKLKQECGISPARAAGMAKKAAAAVAKSEPDFRMFFVQKSLCAAFTLSSVSCMHVSSQPAIASSRHVSFQHLCSPMCVPSTPLVGLLL
jgi:hypothetical protein